MQTAAALGDHAPRQSSEHSGVGACGASEVVEKGNFGFISGAVARLAVVCEASSGAAEDRVGACQGGWI